MTTQLTLFKNDTDSSVVITNVSSVPQRSPFRYPGGKTWLIPIVRQWLKQEVYAKKLIEPFAGGGIVSLTAAFENLADSILMVERDEEVAAVWETILSNKNKWLANTILHYDLTIDNIKSDLNNHNKSKHEVAFCTILKNRILHGGIIAKGSGMIKNGENGKGIASRWYPKTLYNRIIAIDYIKNKIQFKSGDAFDILQKNINNTEAFFFIDPPYTVAGKRLYTYYQVDHEQLFALISQLKGKFMVTYDDTEEIRQLIHKHNLKFRTVPMKTTHHSKKNEIIISDNFAWWSN